MLDSLGKLYRFYLEIRTMANGSLSLADPWNSLPKSQQLRFLQTALKVVANGGNTQTIADTLLIPSRQNSKGERIPPKATVSAYLTAYKNECRKAVNRDYAGHLLEIEKRARAEADEFGKQVDVIMDEQAHRYANLPEAKRIEERLALVNERIAQAIHKRQTAFVTQTMEKEYVIPQTKRGRQSSSTVDVKSMQDALRAGMDSTPDYDDSDD